MKIKFISLFVATCLYGSLSLARANGPVVTIYNFNKTEVYAALRSNDAQPGDNCLSEIKIYPGNSKTFNQ